MSTFVGTSHPSNFIGQSREQPRLSYYITRNNGTFVPLIPADELPFNIRLQGVPRVLNSDQIFGLQQVSMLSYTGLTFKLESEAMTHQRSSSQPPGTMLSRNHTTGNMNHITLSDLKAGQRVASCDPAGVDSGHSRPLPKHELSTNWRRVPASDPETVVNAIVGTKSGAEAAARMGYSPKRNGVPSASGNVPNQEKKEYCTYWIRHGECDYMQQGCLYKHEMPDQSTLRKIGFRSTPRWWLEKTQAVKLGSEKATAGPVVKCSVWLKGDSAEDTGTCSSARQMLDAESTNEKSSSDSDVAEVKSADTGSESTPTDSPTTWPFSTSDMTERKLSVANDLIDLRPLLPTPSSSESSLGRANSNNLSTSTSLQTTSLSAVQLPCEGKSKESSVKVFVPTGEDPEVHIAEANRKAIEN